MDTLAEKNHAPPGTGEKSKANRIASPVNLKLKYDIGRDTPPAVYLSHTAGFDIKAEITGEITIEMLSVSRHLNNLDITLSKDSLEVKQKLRKDYDPAIRELLSKPQVVFESGKVKLKTSLAPEAQASLGVYDIKVELVAPNHFSGTLTPPTISDKKKAEGREYKYSADIEFKVDLFSRPKNQPEPVTITKKVEEKVNLYKSSDHTTKWEETVAEKGTVFAVITVILYTAYRAAELFMSRGMSTTTIPPFIHEIDHRNDHRHNA